MLVKIAMCCEDPQPHNPLWTGQPGIIPGPVVQAAVALAIICPHAQTELGSPSEWRAAWREAASIPSPTYNNMCGAGNMCGAAVAWKQRFFTTSDAPPHSMCREAVCRVKALLDVHAKEEIDTTIDLLRLLGVGQSQVSFSLLQSRP